MIPEDFLAKGRKAARSAAALLSSGDLDGAANRAYYAMFHAARAALASRNIGVKSKRHGALITTFSRHFVKEGPPPAEVGRAINEAQELRHEADYEGLPLSRDEVAPTVRAAEEFVATIERLLRET